MLSKSSLTAFYLLTLAAFIMFVFMHSSPRPTAPQKPLLRRPHHLRTKLTDLVIVPGHGVFTRGKWLVAPWLEPFIPDIEKQIRFALKEHTLKDTLVVFSGGQTNREAGPISEAASYLQAATNLGLAADASPKRVVLEEYALDSYQNLLFSICRFKQAVGEYPAKVTVVGFEFKRHRFTHEHRRAIRLQNFEYIGIGDGKEQEHMEREGAVLDFHRDLFACLPPLSTKRIERNPFFREHPYQSDCPELAELFKACGSEPFSGDLPW